MSEACCPPPRDDDPCCPTSPKVAASACCPPTAKTESCRPPGTASEPCCPALTDDRPGYKIWPFVCGWLASEAGAIPRVSTRLTPTDIFGRWQMRWGLGRSRYSIAPGLYAIGTPTGDSPVLVTANYKMTFDLVRRDLHGHNAWLLILDTRGINVWCAAGKGTFGTDELIGRVKKSKVAQLVSHRTLIIPQLGAPGVAAHKVVKDCGFKVVYGPVRCKDLPAFLANNQSATEEMRRVTFGLVERLVLTPVELVSMWKHVVWSILALFILGGIGPHIYSFSAAGTRGSAAIAAGLLSLIIGAVVVPILLPWLPGRSFAMKGAVAGLVAALFAAVYFDASLGWLNTAALLLAVPAVASWCAMCFTGSSTFTSPSGVEKEMRQAIPAQASALLVGGLCWLTAAF